MPPIRSISTADDVITLVDGAGITRQLLAAAIPAAQNTVAKVEAYINTVWIPANVSGYQMLVHVFSLNPLRVVIGTWNLGTSVSATWWNI